MNRQRWRLSDVGLGDFWKHGEQLYRTIGIVTDPCVVVENLETGERQHHVISSLNFAEFERLRPETTEADGAVRGQ